MIARIDQVLGYLADRDRVSEGSWVSVADVRNALGIDWSDAENSCRELGDAELAELMGGFPLRVTRERFTLVRLTGKGREAAGGQEDAGSGS